MLANQYGHNVSFETWMAALASSACIGFTSLVPWLFNLTFFEHKRRQSQQQGNVNDQGNHQDVRMKYLLSFAVGAILGDIFFHLIPESYQCYRIELNYTQTIAHKKVGLSIITGIFVFIIVEMMLEKWSDSVNNEAPNQNGVSITNQTKMKDGATILYNQFSKVAGEHDLSKPFALNNISLKQGNTTKEFLENNNEPSEIDLNNANDRHQNHVTSNHDSIDYSNCNTRKRNSASMDASSNNQTLKKRHVDCSNDEASEEHQLSGKNNLVNPIVDVSGYLNLIANGLDNFTHGLAIGASFLAGPKVGLLTTFVIFIHEIPHEICDYAILVNSGFSRLEAVKAQSSVSLFGLLGTATALYVKSVDALTASTLWILPFSAGGFLHIALVNLLPELLDRRTNLRDTVGQIACVIIGVSFMAFIAVL